MNKLSTTTQPPIRSRNRTLPALKKPAGSPPIHYPPPPQR